jgi:hypothetical protein
VVNGADRGLPDRRERLSSLTLVKKTDWLEISMRSIDMRPKELSSVLLAGSRGASFTSKGPVARAVIELSLGSCRASAVTFRVEVYNAGKKQNAAKMHALKSAVTTMRFFMNCAPSKLANQLTINA